MLDYLFGLVSHDVGIDLGTSNTFILVKDKGIVIREPSVVARHRKTKQILAIGTEAKKMVGKTPETIEALRPLKHGVISDFDATEAMLRHYIFQVHESHGMLPKIPKPRVVIGIPSGVTEVERRAVQDAALSAGARKAYLIEEPMAAALGADLPIDQPQGQLVVDIGGGTTEIAVISLGGIVVNRSVRIAGDEMDQALLNFFRLKYSLLLGERTAEELKIAVGSAYQLKKEMQAVVRGRDLGTGLPKSLKITSMEVREALSPVVRKIIESISDVIEETPPELVSDVLEKGITMAGGGALLREIDKLISEETKMPVWIAEEPMAAVVRGCGKVLDNLDLLQRVRVTGGLR